MVLLVQNGASHQLAMVLVPPSASELFGLEVLEVDGTGTDEKVKACVAEVAVHSLAGNAAGCSHKFPVNKLPAAKAALSA